MSEFLTRLGGAALHDLKGTPFDYIIHRMMGDHPGGSGLWTLVDRLRHGGLADRVESWISHGENRPVAPAELERALGVGEMDTLAKEAGMERAGLLALLSHVLPDLIDSLTPQGHLPEPHGDEAASAMPTGGDRHPGLGAGGEAGMQRFGIAPSGDAPVPASGQGGPPLPRHEL